MPSLQFDNLTEALQRHLGLQQAQTFVAENVTADAIARLTGKRGDITRLLALWSGQADDVIEGFHPAEHMPVLRTLQHVLEAGVVVQRFANGLPKAFLPLSPELITHKNTNTIFRDLGRSVVEGLWRSAELREEVRTRIESWTGRHPLVQVLSPLCVPVTYDDKGDAGHLAEAAKKDGQLLQWIDGVVAQDWRAWLRATAALSADEQIETMTALIGLHLHVALLWRLRDLSAPTVAPCYFVAVVGHPMDQACSRGAYNCYAYWGDRALDGLYEVARITVDQVAKEDQDLTDSLVGAGWRRPAAWLTVSIKGTQSKRSTNAFHDALKQELEKGEHASRPPRPGEIRELVVSSLVRAFSGNSGVASKAKDYLRTTGRAVGLVGPEQAYSRKRYQMDERALNLLVRLHAARNPEEIESHEPEKDSLEAFLDDIFQRYGIVITRERDRIRQCLDAEAATKTLRPLLKHFPDDESMRRNRAQFDRCLDELRLVRRYSDASAVVHVT